MHEALAAFMKKVGAVGCLIDSVIDLRADRRLGLVGFSPQMSDYTKLIVDILRQGLPVSVQASGSRWSFLAAIGTPWKIDSALGKAHAQPSFVSEERQRLPLV